MSTGPYAERTAKWIADNVDFRVAASADKYPGWAYVHRVGSNQSLSTSPEDIWTVGGIYTPPTTASGLELASTSANDTGLGSGARTVNIVGLDSNFEVISETVTLSGTTVVPTMNDYMRLNIAYVETAGTYRAGAAGDININTLGGGAIQGEILRTAADTTVWNYGQTQVGRFTVPRGKTAFLTRIAIHNEAGKSADFVLFQCGNIEATEAPFCAPRIVNSFSGIEGHDELVFSIPQKFSEMTDIFVRARLTNGANGKVSTDMEFLIYDGIL